jgi:hypothetical protein
MSVEARNTVSKALEDLEKVGEGTTVREPIVPRIILDGQEMLASEALKIVEKRKLEANIGDE